MADLGTVVDKTTVVPTPWIQDVNDFIYRGVVPLPAVAPLQTALGITSLSVLNIAALRLVSVPTAQLSAQVQNYYQGILGGGGVFDWIPGVSVTDNGFDLINITASPSAGHFQRRNADAVTFLKAGAKRDGVTDNQVLVTTTLPNLTKNRGTSIPVTVTISIGSPAVVTWAAHNLRVNEAVVFSTTGALPTGITAGTPYYVLSAGLTANSFQISLLNASLAFTGEGAAVNTSGTQSGAHTAQVQGVDWQEVILEPGAYFTSSFGFFRGNAKRLRVKAYGAVANNLGFGAIGLGSDYAFNRNLFATIQTFAQSGQPSIVTLVNLSDVSKFQVGGWVCLMALDLQNPFGSQQSYPPNTHYCEFAQIAGINSGTGAVTFQTKLRNGYRQTYPQFWSGDGSVPSSNAGLLSGGGPATMVPMCSDWDCERIVEGLHLTNAGFGVGTPARKVTYKNGIFDADGPIPSVNKQWIAEDCKWGVNFGGAGNMYVEVDKLIEYLEFTRCSGPQIVVQSTSVDRMVLKDCTFDFLNGTARNTVIRGGDWAQVGLGPQLFGASESILMEEARIGALTPTTRGDDAGQNNAFNNSVANWTFVNGTLKQPIATTDGNWWAVPGRKMYVNDMAGSFYFGVGAPFTVLDVYKDGSNNFCVDTDLSAMPVPPGGSSNVTISIASPAVVTWTAHGLTAGTPVIFTTTGALPSGLNSATVYYVLAAGLGANVFEFSSAPGGTPVTTTGSQSGTHTAWANPLHFQPHPMPRMTIRNCTGGPSIAQYAGAPEDIPFGSYLSRRIEGFLNVNAANITRSQIFGNLVSLTVNVVRPYTGATNPQILTIAAPAFNGSFARADLSQLIDLRTAGVRTITPAAATGGVGADTLAAFGNWLSGTVSLSATAQTGNFNQQPIVDITIITDQGVTKGRLIELGGDRFGNPQLFADTTTPTT